MARAVGIDLGTTNSLVGYTWRGKETLAPDPVTNREWVPSVVGLNQGGQLIVGSEVEALVDAGHADAIHSVKRLMGRRWDDPQVQRLISEKRLFYTIVEHPDHKGEIGIPLGDKMYTPVEISSLILRRLAEAASAMAGDEISHAVITVPAYFRDPAIFATREAGRMAGLRVKHVMPEPTAAAVAYGADELDDGSGRYIVVFDFGGGTFDVSILLAAGGTLNALRVGGDNFLGGDDVDRAVMERWDDQLRATEGVSILDGVGLSKEWTEKRRVLEWKLKLAARQGKEALAAMESTTVVRPALCQNADGAIVNASWSMSRSDLVAVSKPMLDRALDAVRLTIEEAELSPSDINQVIVAGGSSRLPQVVDRLREMFPESEILNTINPMTAIATGAIRTSRSPFPWTCAECERQNDMTATTCVGCGATAPVERHACDACGALMDVKDEVCPNPECQTRVERHEVPVEVASHDIKVRVIREEGEPWELLVPRDAPIQSDSTHGSAPGDWVILEASRSNMERILLPIAQDVDDDEEPPWVIATFEVEDIPPNLHQGEKVEVRVFMSGDRLAQAEVRIRGDIHDTRRVADDEAATAKEDVIGADTKEPEWHDGVKSRIVWLSLIVHGGSLIPTHARAPENYALIQAAKEPVDVAREYGRKLQDALEANDEQRAEGLVQQSEDALEDTIPIASTLGFATFLMDVTKDLDARRELKQAIDGLAEAIREGDADAPFQAFSALQVAMGEVEMPGGAEAVPTDQQHLLQARMRR